MARQTITTAIDYPNATPHMGHVLEKVLADVCARWMRLRGDEVYFQIGTDEHGIKIQRTAEVKGISPKELVEHNVPLFQTLYHELQISDDKFVRTSDQQQHWPTVIELWKRLHAAGMLEKRSYKGLYCSGCERFMNIRDLKDGQCPNHQQAPEEIIEENWFLTLSQESDWLKTLLTQEGGYRIVPDFRAQETLALIEQGLEDVSFSRPKQTLSWGIPVPGDEEQTMYVWCDALTNYISGIGYFTDHQQSKWWEEAEVTHVIGKDIARFHALYWPAMLKGAGLPAPPPHRLLIHGFLTSEGQKMSKSVGNVVVPSKVLEKYGADPLRFYLSHEIPVGRDGDFSWSRIQELYDAKLRNDIGNLLNRVLVLLQKEGGSIEVPESPQILEDTWKTYKQHMNTFELSEALHVVCKLATACNQFIDQQKPWAQSSTERLATLSTLAENLRHLALLLLPFIPETAQRISTQLDVPYADQMLQKEFVLGKYIEWRSAQHWKCVSKPEILFAPIE